MLLDEQKKYKGIKFLKVEQQIFTNAKKINRKISYNSNSINIQPSLNESNLRKTFKSQLNDILLKTDEERYKKKNKQKNILSFNKRNLLKLNELVALTKPSKIKEEEKKANDNNQEIKISKLFQRNIKPLIYLQKTISCKNLKNLDFNNKTLNKNNINSNNNRKNDIDNKLKNDINVNKKSRINYNDNKNNKENENITNFCKKDNLDKSKANNSSIENKEKSSKKIMKNYFCCI